MRTRRRRKRRPMETCLQQMHCRRGTVRDTHLPHHRRRCRYLSRPPPLSCHPRPPCRPLRLPPHWIRRVLSGLMQTFVLRREDRNSRPRWWRCPPQTSPVRPPAHHPVHHLSTTTAAAAAAVVAAAVLLPRPPPLLRCRLHSHFLDLFSFPPMCLPEERVQWHRSRRASDSGVCHPGLPRTRPPLSIYEITSQGGPSMLHIARHTLRWSAVH